MDFADSYHAIHPRYPEISGQVALVTGAGRGIGRGIAMRLAREGLRVFLSEREDRLLAPALADFRAVGAEVAGASGDLSQPGAPARLMEQALAAFGRIDVLVNNAADLRRTEMLDVTEEFLDYQVSLNFKAPFLLARLAAEQMRARGSGGNIIHISSVGGLRAHWRGLPYDALKGGLDALTRAMALSLSPDQIRVNAIAPGLTFSERHEGYQDDPERQARVQTLLNRIPLRRAATPQDIAATIAFLLSPDGSYITGQVLYVDGGLTAQLSPYGQDV